MKTKRKPKFREAISCKICTKEFHPISANQLYCGRACKDEAWEKKHPIKRSGLSGFTTGAISELRCAVDLLSKGYEVFRAISPACSCDLIALKNNRCVRIEVRTADISKSESGAIKIYKYEVERDKGRQEHYGLILPDQVIYIPPLEDN